MKLIHISEDNSRASGGVRTVIFDLKRQFPESILLSTLSDKDDAYTISFKSNGPWMYSKELRNYLNEIDTNCIFHIHGVWMYAQYIAAKIAYKRNIPFIVTPHGMYKPWLWKKGTLKKKTYFNLFSRSIFKKANYIHAITPDEQKSLQALFPNTPVTCIPNAVDIIEPFERIGSKKQYFLFLGRIHNIKRIDLLIDAFTSLRNMDFNLIIAGPLNDYAKFLQEKVKVHKDNRIKFIGEIRGEDKLKLYRNAHAFVSPSYSEVVGMVNLEAAMMATPVITTKQTGLLKEWNHNGGVLINPDIKALKKALLDSSQWSQTQRDEKGEKLRTFVINHYSWRVVKPKWESLYHSKLS